ncbi:MAG: GatB/YqeY domain-containing protein [Microgenomates group bacterium]
MITDNIKKQIIEAMKAKDEIRLSTLKLLSSALHNAEIDKRGDLTEEEELEVVRREAKKRKDAIEAYEKAGATERAEREKKELVILQKYLPQELSDEEIEKIVDEAISATGAENIKDMGKVIGFVMGKAKGKADGKKVSELVRLKLSK